MTASDLAKATSVPEDVIALKFGIKTKPIAGQEEPTTLHGFMAAQAALEDAAIPADDVDLVIWCGAQHKDYRAGCSLNVANRLGAIRAWSFDMEAMCGSV